MGNAVNGLLAAVLAFAGACGGQAGDEATRTAADVSGFRPPARTPEEVVRGFVWIEAEDFADYGRWKLDTQFVHKMGSAYLLAAGTLKPIGCARTRVRIPSAGRWTAWVRAKDWVPAFHPGTFRLLLGGRPGGTLGASGREGWRWERAGAWDLPAGDAELALEDLSGAFARCDAVLLTTKADYAPPDDADGCEAARAKFTGADGAVADGGSYDLVVVGAGPGGMGAALAAARHGARVALVHDRPVLGGNASREIGVPLNGAAIDHPNARESGICEEACLARADTPGGTFSAVFLAMAERLPNLAVFSNCRVTAVETREGAIAAVLSRNTLTGRRARFSGRLFLDGTGDGWIGYFAGAERMYGREAQAEFDEWPAPETRDDLTMSGCLISGAPQPARDNFLGYRYRLAGGGTNIAFRTPPWADVLATNFCRRVEDADSTWWVEHGGRIDDVADPELARDELVRINVAYWGWLKNTWCHRDRIADGELVEIAFMDGRREGYRLVGDCILTARDCLEGRMFEDRVSYGGWPLDTHDPLGMDSPTGGIYWKHHPKVPIYSIPFRILYSRNVPNLMMAGRDVSATHIALGSLRVESTLLALGQAAGTAAARMLAKGLLPRAYGADAANVRELQQLLLKDDHYIPGLRNEDPDDFARTARVTATSSAGREGFDTRPDYVIDGVARQVGDCVHGWVSGPAAKLPQAITLEFDAPRTVREVRLTFDSDLTPIHPVARPPTLAKAYRVEGLDDSGWTLLAREPHNGLRHRVHGFAPRTIRAIRVTVDETWGDPSARIFEIRAY